MLLNLITYSLLTACLAWFVQYTLKPGEIFGRYGLLLTALWILSNHKTFLLGQHNQITPRQWWAYLLKPLGLCVYCNGAWIAFLVYVFMGVTPSLFIWEQFIGMFLFIGANYIWTKILSKVVE